MLDTEGRQETPLPFDELLRLAHLSACPVQPNESLKTVSFCAQVVQEFRPLPHSLEWDLAKLYWGQSGVDAFGRNEVPFLINNDGRASEDAAATFFALCRETASALSKPLLVLELGAGTGLFARFFLDAFAAICRQEGAAHYDDLVYVVTDASRRTVEQWIERDIFGPHAGHVALAVADAACPEQVDWVHVRNTQAQPQLEGLAAVFTNYLLDVLPAAVVRRTAAGPEQLCVQTSLLDDASAVAQYTRQSTEEIRRCAQNPEAWSSLLPLLPILELETRFEPVAGQEIRYLAEALEWGEGLARVLLNYGALAAIDRWLARLSQHGMMLIRDYGPVRREDVEAQSALQRFGGSAAHGLNWALLEHHVERCGVRVVSAPGDEALTIHTRLLSHQPCTEMVEVFQNRFGKNAHDYRQIPVDRARAASAAGRREEALECYKNALLSDARNWHLIGEVAEFVGMVLRDFAAGVELARAALDRNPWYCPSLWNVLGDCLFCLERFEDAHQAYLQAARINPHDPRAQLNLAYTLAQRGDHAQALTAVARGLAYDVQGAYRTRLLEKQQQILLASSTRWLAEQERLASRNLRLG
jgi:tetratricopeptide (TPR) repeat protein